LDQEISGRFFREAWITGVNKHFPDTPKPGYVAPWEEMGQWEKESAMAVYEQVHAFLLAGIHDKQQTTHLTREQGGRFIRVCWVGQIYKHIPNPKPGYVANWEEVPHWEQEVDMGIFQAIADAVNKEMTV
jgi:hypothetical protein